MTQSNLFVFDNIHHENLKRKISSQTISHHSSLPNKHQQIDSVEEIILQMPEFLQTTLLHRVVAE